MPKLHHISMEGARNTYIQNSPSFLTTKHAYKSCAVLDTHNENAQSVIRISEMRIDVSWRHFVTNHYGDSLKLKIANLVAFSFAQLR